MTVVLVGLLRALDTSALGVLVWLAVLYAWIVAVCLGIVGRELRRAPGEPLQRVDQPVRFTTNLERRPIALGPRIEG